MPKKTKPKEPQAPRTHFGRRLLELRADRGLTRYRLAQLAGLTDEAIRQLERDSAPSFATAQRLALALGVSVAELADPPESFPGILANRA